MSLLFNEPPIAVSPTLASALGLVEAAFLQQLHYWLEEKRTNPGKYKESFADGYFWVYDTAEDWVKKMPYLGSPATFKRMIAGLKKQGIIIVAKYNKRGFDKTNWYRINKDQIDTIVRIKMTNASYQNDQCIVSKCTDGAYQNDTTNTRDYTENTTETTSNIKTARTFENVPLPLDFEDADPPIDPDVITDDHQRPSHSPAMGASGGAAGFDEFWAIYPRAEGRKAAQKAWGKLKPSEQQQATADVRARVDAGAWREVRFVPHAATYLNNSRWLDDWRKVLQQQQAKPQGVDALQEQRRRSAAILMGHIKGEI